MTAGYRKARQFIWASSVLVATITCVMAVLVAVWPLAKPDETAAPKLAPAAATKTIDKPRLAVADFGNTLAKFLQRPLEEPPPPKPVEVVVAAPPPPPAMPMPEIQLLGTAQDSQTKHSMVWLQVPGQPVMLVALGETIQNCPGQPQVERIEAGSATLKFGDRQVELKVKKVSLGR